MPAAASPIQSTISITSPPTLGAVLPESDKTERTVFRGPFLGCFWAVPPEARHMTRARWTRERWFDLVFVVGFALKAIDGFVELVIGLPLLFLRPAQLETAARLFTAGELREDPDDLVAHLVRHGAATLSADATLFAAV